MPTITPNGTVKLLKNVPFTNNYAHSIYFSSVSEQVTYMNSRVDKTLTAQNYIKEEQGAIRLQAQEENARDWCYMMWENPDLGGTPAPADTRWMYAFITQIDFVSPKVVRIHYEVDVLQTYALFNVTFKKCLIERMTPRNDTPGSHIEPEPINLDEYVYDNEYEFFDGDFSSWKILMYAAYSVAEGLNICSQGIAADLPQGVVCNVFDSYSDFKTFMDGMRSSTNYETFINSIVGIFAMPNAQKDGRGMLDTDTPSSHTRNVIKYQSDITTVDGYTPKYKKVLTYPYNCLHITTGNDSADYPYEYFSDEQYCEFTEYDCFNPNPEIMIVPKNYRSADELFDETLSISDFPQIPWGNSSYTQWKSIMNIKKALIVMGGVGKGMQAGASFGKSDSFMNTGGAGGATVGGLLGVSAGLAGGTVAAAGTEIYSRIRGIPTAHSAGSLNGMTVAKALTFKAYQKCLRHDVAERLDDFFMRNGYAIGKIMTPLAGGIPNGRNQLFIKTNGCLIVGACPAEYGAKIEKIFDSGITWWNKDHVGDYN